MGKWCTHSLSDLLRWGRMSSSLDLEELEKPSFFITSFNSSEQNIMTQATWSSPRLPALQVGFRVYEKSVFLCKQSVVQDNSLRFGDTKYF